MRKQPFILTLLALTATNIAMAQTRPVLAPAKTETVVKKHWSVEAGVGLASYYGDLTDKAEIFNQPHFSSIAGVTYAPSDHFYPTFNIGYSKIGADDKNNDRADLRLRNLNFESNVVEFNLGLRFNVLKSKPQGFTPYLYAGVGVFHFNPYTTDRFRDKQYLQRLGTEGQRINPVQNNAYNLTQFQIPYGGGVSYRASDRLDVRLDVTFRKTFTDYLDDVSTVYVNSSLLAAYNPRAPFLAFRGDEISNAAYPKASLPRGNSKERDFYYSTLIKVGYRL